MAGEERLNLSISIPLHSIVIQQMAAEGHYDKLMSDMKVQMKQMYVFEFFHEEKKKKNCTRFFLCVCVCVCVYVCVCDFLLCEGTLLAHCKRLFFYIIDSKFAEEQVQSVSGGRWWTGPG